MRKMIAALLAVSLLFLLFGCGVKTDTAKWIWSAQQQDLPENFGNVLGVAKTDSAFFAASYSAFGRWDPESGSIVLLDTIYRENISAMIYDITSFADTVYLLTGEMPPQYTDNGQEMENTDFSGRYTLVAYGSSGVCQYRTDFQLDGSVRLIGALALSEEYILCWTRTNAWVIQMSDGSISEQEKLEGTITAPMVSTDGAFLCVKENDNIGFYQLQAGEDALGEYTAVAECPVNYSKTVSDSTVCLIDNHEDLSLISPSRQTATAIMKWHDCALSGITMTSMAQVDEDTWLCASYIDNGLWTIQRQSLETGRKTLHIATAWGSQELDELVKQFNAAHKDCTAVVDYYPENAYDRLCTEMVAGDGPDVLDLFGLSLPQNSPYLEDLYQYIDADPAIDREIFLPTVLGALENNGALRSIPAVISITTLTAKTAEVGGRNRWTFDEMCSTLEQQNSDMHLLPKWLSRLEFLKWIATISTGSFIDWETYTAHYDSEEFCKYLSFCSDLPAEDDITNFEQEWPHLVELQGLENLEVVKSVFQTYGEPITYIGFPCESGSGSFFVAGPLHFAISANSREKDLSWQFISSALTAEKQRDLVVKNGHFPIRDDVLRNALEQEIEDAAMREQFYQLATRPNIFIAYNDEITKIILEEAPSCFNGEKSVEETADRIQGRITLYLSEIS